MTVQYASDNMRASASARFSDQGILKLGVIAATSRLLRLGIENAGVCPLRPYNAG